jgi:hypothetical protein
MVKTNWALTVPVSKAEDRDGKWIITGLVSGPGLDAQGHQMTDAAIDRLAQRLNEAPVPLRNWHKTDDITSDLGETLSAWKTDEGDLQVDIELDQDNKDAEYLWKKIHKGKEYGFSIHGPVEATFEFSHEAGKKVPTLHDVAMDEISVTTKPAFVKSLGSVVSKSLQDAHEEEMNLSENVQTDDTVVSDATEASAPEVTSEATETVVSKSTDETPAWVATFMTQMSDLFTQAGLIKTEDSASTSETVPTDTEKSLDAEDEDALVVVKSLSDKITGLEATIESLKELIPGTELPDVTSKSRSDELAEVYSQMSASEKIRFGLAMSEKE